MKTNPLDPLVRKALSAYPIELIQVVPIRAGNNAVYQVLTELGESFALRIHRKGYRTPEETESELCYLQGLSATVDVPTAIRMRDGGTAVKMHDGTNPRHASLLTWVKGRVRRPHGKGAGSRTIFRIGKALGQIHAFSSTFTPPDWFSLPVWDGEGILGAGSIFLSESLQDVFGSKHLDLLKVVRDRFEYTFEEIGRTTETFGVIHKDFILLNCLHYGNQTGVIDFDDCGWGHYLCDLGGILGNLKDYPSYRRLRSFFLQGYRSVHDLPSEWEKHFDLMIAVRHAASALWIAGRWQVGDVDKETFEQHAAYRFREVEQNL